jgi:hypothetical protein
MPLINSNPKPQAKQEHKGLFGEGGDKPKAEDTGKVNEQVMNIDNKLRVMEERTSNLQRRYMVNERNTLSTNRKFNSEIKTINMDINELKKEINQIKIKILQIIEELKKGARKEDMNMIKKYVDLWEPVNFVTRHEVETLINDILREKKV